MYSRVMQEKMSYFLEKSSILQKSNHILGRNFFILGKMFYFDEKRALSWGKIISYGKKSGILQRKCFGEQVTCCVEMSFSVEKSHIFGEEKSYFGEKSAILREKMSDFG